MTTPGDLILLVWVIAMVSVITVLVVHMLRTAGKRKPPGRGRRDNDLHRIRAGADAEIAGHDIDDMLDAIAERRRRAGSRSIGEELADELLRGTWSDAG